MTFHRGEPGIFDDRGGIGPDNPFEPFVVRVRARGGRQGRPRPDRDARAVLGGPADLPQDGASSRTTSWSPAPGRPASWCPGLTLTVRDERGIAGTPGADGPHEETFLHSGGVVDFVDHLAPDTAVTDTWHLTGSGTFTETVPVLDDRGHMTAQEVSRTCEVDIALRWGTGYETEVRSFVNIISTPKGGTHLAGFEAGLLRTHAQGGRRERPAAEDLGEGHLRADREGGRARRDDRGRDRPAGRAAVRGPDQGGARHRTGARDRRQGGGHRARRDLRLAQARPQGAVVAAAGQGRRRDARPAVRAQAEGDLAAQERARDLVAAGQARRLPQRRRRAQRAVHRRGRQRAGHRQAGAQLGLPGAAAHPRQDPQRPEGVRHGHAQERRVRRDHPGGRRRVGSLVRPGGARATGRSS